MAGPLRPNLPPPPPFNGPAINRRTFFCNFPKRYKSSGKKDKFILRNIEKKHIFTS